MNRAAMIIFLVAPFVVSFSTQAGPTSFNDHAYEAFFAPRIAWDNASTFAKSLTFKGAEGHLATITSAAEDQFLHAFHRTVSDGEFWVGSYLTCSPHQDCVWQWTNNEGSFPRTNYELGYANWFNGEPNGDGTHSTIGRFDPLIGWNDEGDLSFIRGYIVEWEPSAIPEPTTFALIALGLAGLGFAHKRRVRV